MSILNFFKKTKTAEEKLRKMNRAVEQNPASVVLTNRDGNIEYVNTKFENITGYKSDEVIGKNPRFLKSGNSLIKRKMESFIGNGFQLHLF